MPWLLLIIKHILPISELYSSFRRTDLTTGDISTGSTQEDPSQHDWKNVDLDVKNQIKQKAFIMVLQYTV